MKTLCFISLLVFAHTTWAAQNKKVIQLSNGEQQIRVIYGEEDHYFVDTFKIEKNGWQERTEQKRFSNETDAQNYFDIHTQGYADSVANMNRNKINRPTVKIWEVTDQWNADWEAKYTQWVKENLNDQFFIKYQIPTDCADVAYSIRWIFSRIHGLPAVVTLAGSENLFAQNNGKESWENIPTSDIWYEDQRFKKALLYIMNNTFTHTLVLESYPVEISPQGVQPGGYHLTVRTESGHTRMIYSTNPTGHAGQVIRFVASDVPAEIRELHEEPFSLKKAIVQGYGGFLRFRWPKLNENGTYSLTPAIEMPYYSLEQYSDEFVKSYYKSVLTHMGSNSKPEDYLRLRMELVWDKWKYRVRVVQEGIRICTTEDCTPGTINYENWGTPSRDAQIYDLVQEISEIYWQHYEDQNVTDEYLKWQDKALQIDSQTTILFSDLIQAWEEQYYSSDPRDDLYRRWGLSPY